MRKEITMNDKVARIIKDHSDELTKLATESDDALETFRITVSKLDGINHKISESVNLMDQQIANLSTIKENMMEKKAKNEKVKNKIEEFLA